MVRQFERFLPGGRVSSSGKSSGRIAAFTVGGSTMRRRFARWFWPNLVGPFFTTLIASAAAVVVAGAVAQVISGTGWDAVKDVLTLSGFLIVAVAISLIVTRALYESRVLRLDRQFGLVATPQGIWVGGPAYEIPCVPWDQIVAISAQREPKPSGVVIHVRDRNELVDSLPRDRRDAIASDLMPEHSPSRGSRAAAGLLIPQEWLPVHSETVVTQLARF